MLKWRKFLSLNTRKIINSYRISNENQLLLTKMGCSTSKLEISRSATMKTDEYVEDIICKESDIKENEMKSFDFKDLGKILLIRQNGKLNALGAKCTHYGAPLEKGALGNGRVRCQWHGACFNIETGDIEDFPGLDSLPCYQVTIIDNNVKIRAKKSELETNKRCKQITKRSKSNLERFIIIGGGPSGQVCSETLRQNGFNGEILLICKEPYYPYDRIKISKVMDAKIENLQLRPDNFYNDNYITVLKNCTVLAVDGAKKHVTLDNGNNVTYEKLYIATGMRANRGERIEGAANLKNIFTVRNYNDAKLIYEQLHPNKEVIILGGNFIGMEVANFLVNKVKKVTIILRSKCPFEVLLGERIGNAFMALYKEKNVNFICNSGIQKFINNDGNERISCILLDGTEVIVDFVILGIGGKFETDFLKDSGINLRTDGSVDCDDYLKCGNDVWAGGDIACAPVWMANNEKATIGHFSLAHYHGRIAALNMLGKNEKLKSIPYFWTMVFGKGLRYCGYGKYDDIIYNGNVESYTFAAYYLNKNDQVIAIASCGMDPIVSQFAEFTEQGKKLFRKDVINDNLEWTKIT